MTKMKKILVALITLLALLAASVSTGLTAAWPYVFAPSPWYSMWAPIIGGWILPVPLPYPI
ncbi:MAG: hypothetical protein ACTSXC_00520 [Candidatus Freyarchaeota archaeon]